MKRILVLLALGCSLAAAAACSSSSSPAGGGEDAGGGHDATSGHADGSGGDGAGNGEASGFGDGSFEGGAAETGSDGGSGLDATQGEGGGSDGATEAGADADGGIGDAGNTPECGSTPSLHVDEAGSVYCGFNGVTSLYCGTGQECCLGGALGGGTFAPEQCAALGATCPNAGAPDAGAPAIPIACGQIADCTADGVTNAVACCLQGATAPVVVAGCGYPKATQGTAVVCESSDAGVAPGACAAGEVELCSSQADCPTGTTCTPGKWKIFQVGFCL